jgi:hypothetical protein
MFSRKKDRATWTLLAARSVKRQAKEEEVKLARHPKLRSSEGWWS